MAGITLAQAQAQLDLWLNADAAVARKQSYSIAGRSLTLADASDIRANIEYWNSMVQKLTAAATGRGRLRYGVAE
ncbi:DUF6148 family protein [Sinorhizobium fredii]|uniref:DUF6148 family protein n=1 Tax=Rhizobium fredii TaxID=380 RepID=UPI0004B20B76|nr:DUF6148 family protein [Sinorhizobium fredii]AWI57175.1 hypothetical protein AB395_00001516 [Sinorhizobium fredii CCBAU 45436]